MSLLKSKQIDLDDLAVELANKIAGNNSYKSTWKNLIGGTFYSAVFSAANSNISNGQTNFSITYSPTVSELLLFRNGSKLVYSADYSYSQTSTTLTITLVDPIAASSGGIQSEVIEVNYY